MSLALLPHDSVWAIVTIALSRLMLSMEGITPNGISTDGDEEEDSKPIQRPLSQAAISADFRRDLERRLSFPRSGSQTPMSKSQKQTSIAETVVIPESDTEDRRSSKGSTYSQKGKQRPSSVIQKEAYANPAWFPGAIEENPSVLRSLSPASLPPAVISGRASPTPTDRSASPPLGYVRPLPSIPGTSSLFAQARPHSRSLSASPQPRHSINVSRPTHQSAASASGPVSTISSSSTLYSPPQPITQVTLRGSEANSSPNLGASRDVNEVSGSLANREVHEMRLLPPRPSKTPLSNDSHPWMESQWPEIAYPNAPPQPIVDRRGDIKASDFGGVEF